MSDNIKVAVRVRPFSDREVSRKSQLIVTMDNKTTCLLDPAHPKSDPRKFTYDYSYWSHDGFRVREDGYLESAKKKYIDQNRVFTDLGQSMLANAWKGYNCSIFAYGQTGSGKSYSIMGHGTNKGLVPRISEELFTEIENKKSTKSDVSFEVTFSMLYIYNEQVRDLLSKKKTPPGGLKIKERPDKGFYVEGLSIAPVGNYQDIKVRMNEGNRQRTIAATKMNETSSRAHTIITINFKQNMRKTKTTKHSSINMVDLAGSERAKQTESTGDRFEEAKNINKSLMTLGNVMNGLVSKAKGQSTHIPYRDAVLTKLLKNALGGNSKTVMIAAISPDAENYDQTLSTLRYADRAKAIKTLATVNEEATNKLIAELIKEKERLLHELESAKTSKDKSITDEEIQRLKEEQEKEIHSYKEQMEDNERAWEKRLEDARKEMEDLLEKEKQAEEEEKKTPHFYNLNEDPALVGKIRHMIRRGTLKIGNGKDDSIPDIVLNGPRIAKEHAQVNTRNGQVFIRPVNGLLLHNGKELTKEVELKHQDRIRCGSNNLFVFNNPTEARSLEKRGKVLREITFEFAQGEIAKHSGINISSEDGILQEEVMSIMQLVQDVNAMAEDMDKPCEFAILLVSAEARGQESGRTEIYVKMHDLQNDHDYLWDKKRFLNRQVHMQELYQQYEEKGKSPQIEKEKDPFWEPEDTEVIVGVVSVPLNYLSHMLEFQDEPLSVIDYKARQSGFLKVDLVPCDFHANEDDDLCVEDPMDLVGKNVAFKIKVHQAMNLPNKFVKTWCRYKFYQDTHFIVTDVAEGRNPLYNHDQLIKMGKKDVTHKFIDYLRERSLTIEVWGQQGSGTSTAGPGKSRREAKQRVIEELDHYKGLSDELNALLDEINTVVDRSGGSHDMKEIRKILAKRP